MTQAENEKPLQAQTKHERGADRHKAASQENEATQQETRNAQKTSA